MESLAVIYVNLTYICFALSAVCLLQLTLLVWLFYKKRVRDKREKFKQADRDLKFTLPERENTFVRDRLKGSLRPQEENGEGTPANATALLKDLDVRLEYTRKTISKLKASVLTPADRLEINRISKTVTFYALKNALSPSETRTLNDCFSRLLKLAVKYAV